MLTHIGVRVKPKLSIILPNSNRHYKSNEPSATNCSKPRTSQIHSNISVCIKNCTTTADRDVTKGIKMQDLQPTSTHNHPSIKSNFNSCMNSTNQSLHVMLISMIKCLNVENLNYLHVRNKRH